MELFDTTALVAAERRRAIDAAQVPGQIDVFEAIADVEAEHATPVELAMPTPAGELFTAAEARGQMVLA